MIQCRKVGRGILHVKTNRMKHAFLTLAVVVMFFGTGCYHPVSTMFETAHSLDEGDTRLTLGGTLNPESQTSYAGRSFLGIVDHGIAEKTDFRLRLERRNDFGDFDVPYSYLEAGLKWSFGNDLAFSLPVQFYSIDGDEIQSFLDPRFLFSRGNSNLEFTGVIHVQTGRFEGDFAVIPGAAIGIAVGEDIDAQALRVEAGYNSLKQITFGLGFQFLSGQRFSSRHQIREPSTE